MAQMKFYPKHFQIDREAPFAIPCYHAKQNLKMDITQSSKYYTTSAMMTWKPIFDHRMLITNVYLHTDTAIIPPNAPFEP